MDIASFFFFLGLFCFGSLLTCLEARKISMHAYGWNETEYHVNDAGSCNFCQPSGKFYVLTQFNMFAINHRIPFWHNSICLRSPFSLHPLKTQQFHSTLSSKINTHIISRVVKKSKFDLLYTQHNNIYISMIRLTLKYVFMINFLKI